jgi:transcriptional regulator with XRE-family HTH domain
VQLSLEIRGDIGRAIKRHRILHDLTQNELAERARMPTPTGVWKAENGKSGVSPASIRAIARALDTTLEVLMQG